MPTLTRSLVVIRVLALLAEAIALDHDPCHPDADDHTHALHAEDIVLDRHLVSTDDLQSADDRQCAATDDRDRQSLVALDRALLSDDRDRQLLVVLDRYRQ
jgi:hypothetical protein